MKRVMMGLVLVGAILFAGKSYAGTMTWGSHLADYSDFVSFTDNNNDTFTGYAYLFLLASESETVTWNGTGWSLGTAEQIAYSGAGTLDGVPGTFGALDASISDDVMFGDRYYQVILTTVTGNALLTGVGVNPSEYYASTTPVLLDDFFGGTWDGQLGKYVDKQGSAAWQDIQGSWQPLGGEAVPEPTTMALFGLGGLAMVIRRKMRKEA